jgi:hypothetical protein
MALSRSSRIKFLLAIDVLFFLVELIVGKCHPPLLTFTPFLSIPR